MSINYQALYGEVVNDPANIGYSGKSDEEIANLLNLKNRTKINDVRVTDRMLIGTYDDPVAAETFLQKLEAAAKVNPLVARVVSWISPSEGGIDAGHPNTIAMLDVLVSSGVFTTDEATKFKNLAQTTVSRADELGFPPVLSGYITKARLQNG